MAYPIYLTIGNIPKDIRRKPSRHAHILIGYIPVTKLTGIRNKAARRRRLGNLFHGCMRTVLEPIGYHGETGVPMMSGDGVWRRCHPIMAIFVGDYPEQALVSCTYQGRCPKCEVPPGQLGEYETFPSCVQSTAIDNYLLADGDVRVFHRTCRDAGLKAVYHPFWERLPLADIFLSITPDILHQLLQGMMKHLIRWLIRVFGPGEINARGTRNTAKKANTLFQERLTRGAVQYHPITILYFFQKAYRHFHGSQAMSTRRCARYYWDSL